MANPLDLHGFDVDREERRVRIAIARGKTFRTVEAHRDRVFVDLDFRGRPLAIDIVGVDSMDEAMFGLICALASCRWRRRACP